MLGPAEHVEAVLEGLLVERGARQEFEPYEPPEPTIEGRTDLRDLTTFTIDPDTAKDFDDAISVRREGDGVRAWVHIADVSYFVEAGSPLDRGAAGRAFSTYVPGLVAPMLPPELSDDAVLAAAARRAPDRHGRVPAGRRRAELLPLGDPQRRAPHLRPGAAAATFRPRSPRSSSSPPQYSAELRRRRFARGALRVERPELVFEFDGKGGVADARWQGEPEAHALVEELMILANEAVAGLLAGRRREALYRVHERPDPQSVSALVAKLAALDVPTPPLPELLTAGDAAAAPWPRSASA